LEQKLFHLSKFQIFVGHSVYYTYVQWCVKYISYAARVYVRVRALSTGGLIVYFPIT